MRLSRLWPVLAGMLVGGLCTNAFAQKDGAVTLQWTAPGDDSLTGTATRYDLRYSLFPINEANFAYCPGPGGLPVPDEPGTPQSFTVYGLLPGLRYYFALKTADERLNWSGLSNVVAFAQPAVDVGEDLRPISFSAPVPNPSRSSAAFTITLPSPTHVNVMVFDLQGRIVRFLADMDLDPGERRLDWNLRDVAGSRVAPGVYLARARIGDQVFTRRILVAR